jgi:ABC-type transport system involved in multi-copper enzyme maturation permease subunit
MFQQVITIARNTFTESIRQPIFAVLILVGILGLALNLQLAAYTFDDDNLLLVQFGLSTILLVCLLLAAFTATSVLSEEIETRTVLTVVSKPVPRPVFVLGKYLGVTGAITLAMWVLSIVFLMTLRHRVMTTARDDLDGPVLLFASLALLGSIAAATLANYLYRKVFTSVLVKSLAGAMLLAFLGVLLFAKGFEFQSPVTELLANNQLMLECMVALVIVLGAVWVLTAVAIAASTRLGQVMTLMICLGVFLVGLISGSLDRLVEQQLGLGTTLGPAQTYQAIFASEVGLGLKTVYVMLQTLYLVLPNLQLFWPADAITQGNSLIRTPEGDFSLMYLGSTAAYAVLYITAVLGLAVALFQQREVG